jgi:hypothetical protein
MEDVSKDCGTSTQKNKKENSFSGTLVHGFEWNSAAENSDPRFKCFRPRKKQKHENFSL